MWFRTAINIDSVSVEGVEHSVTAGYLELPDDLQPGTIKFLVEHEGFSVIAGSEVADSLKGPKLPPVFEDAGYKPPT